MNIDIRHIRSIITYNCKRNWSWNLSSSGAKDWDYWAVWEGFGWGEIDSRSFELQRGSVLLIPPGSRGHIEHHPDHPLKVTACHLDLQGFEKKLISFRTIDLKTQLLQLGWLVRAWQLGDVETTRARLHSLLWEMLKSPHVPSAVPNGDLQVERWKVELKRMVGHQPSIKEMAALSHMTPQHLGRLFHKKVGCNPSQYALSCRLERAEEMLSGGRDSIDRVASSCGWEDPSAFARSFKKAKGLSPTVFRHSRKEDLSGV